MIVAMRGWLLRHYPVSLGAARGHAVINGSGQEETIAGRPTHDHGTNSPQLRTHTTHYSPVIAPLSFNWSPCRLGPERFFFLWRLMLYWFIKSSSCVRFRQNQTLSRHTANDRVCLTHSGHTPGRVSRRQQSPAALRYAILSAGSTRGALQERWNVNCSTSTLNGLRRSGVFLRLYRRRFPFTCGNARLRFRLYRISRFSHRRGELDCMFRPVPLQPSLYSF
jgi:hypothetical protein